MQKCITAYGLALMLAFAAQALAAPRAIYTTFGALSGAPDGNGQFISFDRPVRSPSGAHWMLLARTNAASAQDAVYITGAGLTGTLRIREGVTPLVEGRVGENISDRRVGINDDGTWAAPINLNGATTDDQIVLRGTSAGVLDVYAREGQPVPAAAGLPGGTVYGSSVQSTQISNSGAPTFLATVVGSGITSSNDGVGFLANGSIGVREGTGGLGALGFNGFYTNAAGDKWATTAVISGAPSTANDAFIVDGNGVLLEGDPIAGVDGTISSFYLPEMNSNGDWLARGRNSTGTGWAIRNGELLAKTGDAVPGGDPGETWSSAPWGFSTDPTFFHLSANNVGDYLLGGFTDNADGTRNAAWVLNGNQVVLRNGDQVDVDGDGVLDNAYITFTGLTGASPSSLGGILTDDLGFYFEASLRDAAGTALGSAFLYVQVPEPASLTLVALAGLLIRRR